MPFAYINDEEVDASSLSKHLKTSPVGTTFILVISRSLKYSISGKKTGKDAYEYYFTRKNRKTGPNVGTRFQLATFINEKVDVFLSETVPKEKPKIEEKPPLHPIETLEPIKDGIATNGTRRKVFGRGKHKSTRRRKTRRNVGF